MKNRLILALLTLFTPLVARTYENTWDYAVQVSASAQTSPPQITLTWPQDVYFTPDSYTVYRKDPSASSWGTGTVLPGTATSYVDTSVTIGATYEYQIVKIVSAGSYNGFGYIYTGINVPPTHSRGKIVLVVDNTYQSSLASELSRLQQDLIGDGWTVIRHDVSRNATPPSVRSIIQSDYNADPANVKALFLFGHVPVPYSGDIAPDEHIPEHQGAWPADVYYGDMNGTWTDTLVNDTGASDSRNDNTPGDGKFDQPTIPSDVELQVGRVDLANLPGWLPFWETTNSTFISELELLRQYLNKDHNFRHTITTVPRRALVGDAFGPFYPSQEAFAASGYRNFAPFFGAANIIAANTAPDAPPEQRWISLLGAGSYLWAYGCGAGSYPAMARLGTHTENQQDHWVWSTDIVGQNAKAVFTMFFGSFLGDWDSTDNIMRAVLATPTYGLTCSWSGRPHHYYHHMGLGETVGYGIRLSQNNNGLYQNYAQDGLRGIHIALMGDPTLRLHPVIPASNLSGTQVGGSANLTWTASTDTAIKGYYVYRSSSASGPFTLLNNNVITATSYSDPGGGSGSWTYMVRASKLEGTPTGSFSGSYTNLSQGIFASVGGATVWVEDAVPAGAWTGADGGDFQPWLWVSSNPAPYSGTQAHQSAVASGIHWHYFSDATTTLTVNPGDTLITFVNLDSNNRPREIMLQWTVSGGTSDHRAYWGENLIPWGTDGTASQYPMGALPGAGSWATLAVPASVVGLEGTTLTGMAFILYDGRATWDHSGK